MPAPNPAVLTDRLATPARKHIAAFDGIRAVAILMVLVVHSDFLLNGSHGVMRWVGRVAEMGWCGVDLFFVLSGFLITGILLDTRQATNYFQSFYARRALRIFPVYYLALCILVASRGFWNHLGTPLPPNPVWLFTYLNNWVSPKAPPTPYGAVVGHFWSLAVEEQFYCLWPFCVWMAGPRNLWKVCVVGIIVALVARCCFMRLYGPTWFVYEALFTRMDTLLMGALAALVARNANALEWIKVMARPVGIVTVAATLGVAIWLRDYLVFMQTGGYTLLAFGFACIVLWAYAGNSADILHRGLRWKGLTTLGIISYGMYVYHLPVLRLIALAFGPWYVFGSHPMVNWLVFLGTVFLITFALAWASYVLYESRFLALKDRFKARIVKRDEQIDQGNRVVTAVRQ